MMDGRVKTLHPKIHGGLLGRRGTDDAVIDFDVQGVWMLMNNNQWDELTGIPGTGPALAAVAGDVDGNGQEDLVVSYADTGVWTWMKPRSSKPSMETKQRLLWPSRPTK